MKHDRTQEQMIQAEHDIFILESIANYLREDSASPAGLQILIESRARIARAVDDLTVQLQRLPTQQMQAAE